MAYRVTGAFVQVTSAGPTGTQKIALYQGAILPGDVPAEEIRHHLSVGMIEQVGDDEGPVGEPLLAPPPPGTVPTGFPAGTAGDPANGTPPAAVTGGDSVAYDDPERVKAREKLPPDGSAPHPNAGEAVWVEYAVAKGYSFEAVRDAGKDQIRGLFA